MSSRFEKIIAGAVMAGAIAMAGCDAGSSGNGAGNGDGIAPTLVGARTVSSTEIELTFSEAVTVSDPAAAAAMFVLNRNILNYGFNYASTTIASVYYPTAAYPYYSFQSGSAIGAVTDVQSVSASPAKLTLTIDTAIVADVDHGGTGMLRLTYTGAEGGVSDEAGNALGDIALDSTQRGNVLDATGDPVLIDARTIDSNTIELTFNEPITTADPSAIASFFLIGQNCRLDLEYNSPTPYITSAIFMSIYTPYFSIVFSRNTYPVTGLSIPSGTNGNKAILTTSNTILDSADYEGYLRLVYTGEGQPDAIEDLSGFTLKDVPAGAGYTKRRGNLRDTLGADGSCFYTSSGG